MPSPYKDVVVFIPGILGSTLAKNGTPIWGTDGQAILNMALDGLDALALPESGSLKPDLGDEISVTGLTPNIEIVPGLWKLGGYSRISVALENLPGLFRGQNYFEFPYDWRRDNRVAARRLQVQAESWLRNWIQETQQPDAKLVLVVHSMGGLVARYFIECLEGWRSTRMLIAAGSPFRGSGNALDFLVNGATLPDHFSGLSRRFDPLRDIDSLYQLLPTYPFIRQRHREMQYIAEADYLPLDRERIRQGRAFHAEIEKAEASNQAIEDYRAEARLLRTIIGIGQPTIQSAIWDEGALYSSHEWKGRDHGGDTVVARPSATPLDRGEDVAMFTANSHAVMPSDEAVLAHIRGLLSSPDLDLTRFRRSAQSSFCLNLDDAVVAGEPMAIKVRALGEPLESATAIVEYRGDVVEKVPLRTADGESFTGEVVLEPGNYLVRVGAEGIPEVGDVVAALG